MRKIGVADHADAFSFDKNTNGGLALEFVFFKRCRCAAAFGFLVDAGKKALAACAVVIVEGNARDGNFEQTVARVVFLLARFGGFLFGGGAPCLSFRSG